MKYGTITFIESGIVVEFHELCDLNGLKASEQVFSGPIHFFDADVVHDADIHGFCKDVLQIALRHKKLCGNIFCVERRVEVFSDKRDGTCNDFRHLHRGKVRVLRIIVENDEQFTQKRNEQRIKRIGRINFGIGIESLKKFKNGAVCFFTETVEIRNALRDHFIGEIDDEAVVIFLRRRFQYMVFPGRDEEDRVFCKFIGDVFYQKSSAAFGYV